MAKKMKKYGIPILAAIAIPGGLIALTAAGFILYRQYRRSIISSL